MVKGAGADCFTFPWAVYKACELIGEDFEVERYGHDWYAQATGEAYLRRVMRYAPLVVETICRRVTDAKPGALVLSRCARSRFYNHAGIVTNWPHLVHAANPDVAECCAASHRLWTHREIAILDPFYSGEQPSA